MIMMDGDMQVHKQIRKQLLASYILLQCWNFLVLMIDHHFKDFADIHDAVRITKVIYKRVIIKENIFFLRKRYNA